MLHKQRSLTYAIPYFDDTGMMRGPYLICKGFLDAGWHVEIATTTNFQNTNIERVWERVPVNKVNGSNKKIQLIKLARKLFKADDKNVVISWIWHWHCFALMVSKWLFGSHYVLVLDTYTHLSPWETKGFLSKLRLELRYGLIMRFADIILAESPLSYEHARRHIEGPEILLVPVCFWEKDLREVERRWSEEGFRPSRKPMILYAGQIVERKNIHDLIIAFSRLSEQFPEWRLEIRGQVTDPYYLASLRDLAKHHESDDRIEFLPSLTSEDLYRRYRSSSIYCLPSSFEGMPTTILEAMYFGGAIVAGSAGHISYQLDDGNCGLLFEPGDLDCLTEHLENLMSSQSKREHYIKKARERLLSLFTWENYFDRVEGLFRHLTAS